MPAGSVQMTQFKLKSSKKRKTSNLILTRSLKILATACESSSRTLLLPFFMAGLSQCFGKTEGDRCDPSLDQSSPFRYESYIDVFSRGGKGKIVAEFAMGTAFLNKNRA